MIIYTYMFSQRIPIVVEAVFRFTHGNCECIHLLLSWSIVHALPFDMRFNTNNVSLETVPFQLDSCRLTNCCSSSRMRFVVIAVRYGCRYELVQGSEPIAPQLVDDLMLPVRILSLLHIRYTSMTTVAMIMIMT